jgi:hypothetical protein
VSTAVDSGRTSLELVEDEHSEVVIGGATRANTRFAGACARIGALVQLAGLVEPLRTRLRPDTRQPKVV